MEWKEELPIYNQNRHTISITLAKVIPSSRDTNGTSMDDNMTSQCSSESCDLFSFIVQGIIGFIVCTVGLFGNFLSLLTIHTIGKSSVTYFLFRSLAIIDTLYLTTYGLVVVASAVMLYFDRVKDYYSVYQYVVYLIFPFSVMTLSVTSWVTVLLSIHR